MLRNMAGGRDGRKGRETVHAQQTPNQRKKLKICSHSAIVKVKAKFFFDVSHQSLDFPRTRFFIMFAIAKTNAKKFSANEPLVKMRSD